MFRLGLVDTLVTLANIKGFGLTPLSGDHRGYMPPLLQTKTKQNKFVLVQISVKGWNFHNAQAYNEAQKAGRNLNGLGFRMKTNVIIWDKISKVRPLCELSRCC